MSAGDSRARINECVRRYLADTVPLIAAEIADRVIVELPATADPVDAIALGCLVTSGEAAKISNISDETLRLRCEQTYSSSKRLGAFSYPGVLRTWHISLPRLLDLVEAKKGIDARREAEARAEELMRRKAREADDFLANSKQDTAQNREMLLPRLELAKRRPSESEKDASHVVPKKTRPGRN
jgi:hypothetical protein